MITTQKKKKMKVKSNFLLRTISGLIFVAILVGLPLLGENWFKYLFAVIGIVTAIELIGLINKSGEAKVSKISSFLGAYFLIATLKGTAISTKWGLLIYLSILVIVFIAELYKKAKKPINNLAYWLFVQVYAVLPFALINLLSNSPISDGAYSPLLPLAMFAFIWSTDTGAYCVGSMIGRNKLFPRISPNKSWEGAVGGVLIAVAVGYVFSIFFEDLTVLQWMGFALLVSIFGTLGDLVESLLKRTWGIKDSGNIIPGHGGMLDRFDSSLMAIPVSVIYIYMLTY